MKLVDITSGRSMKSESAGGLSRRRKIRKPRAGAVTKFYKVEPTMGAPAKPGKNWKAHAAHHDADYHYDQAAQHHIAAKYAHSRALDLRDKAKAAMKAGHKDKAAKFRDRAKQAMDRRKGHQQWSKKHDKKGDTIHRQNNAHIAKTLNKHKAKVAKKSPAKTKKVTTKSKTKRMKSQSATTPTFLTAVDFDTFVAGHPNNETNRNLMWDGYEAWYLSMPGKVKEKAAVFRKYAKTWMDFDDPAIKTMSDAKLIDYISPYFYN